MNQKESWDKIASDWYEFKKNKTTKTELELKKLITNFLKKQKGKILDLGSGTGRYLTKIKNGKMYEVDFSKEMIKFAKEKSKKENIPAEFNTANATKLPFKNNFFDSAIFIATLHSIKTKKNRIKAVKELFRVLNPSASVLVSVWNKNSKWFKKRPKEVEIKWKNKYKRYLYLFEKDEIHTLFKNTGFIIKNKIPNNYNIIFTAKKP